MSLKSLFVSLLTIALVCEPALATTPMLGQVMVKGNAKINGMLSPSGATVFTGDQLATETRSVAELILNDGSKVLLPESSAVVLSSEASQVIVNLKRGALATLSNNSKPTFVDANGARIRPAAGTAVVLEVAVNGESLKVLARRGSAIVETEDKTLTLEEGRELDATMAPPSPRGSGIARPAARNKLGTFVFITAAAAGVTGLALGVVALSRPNPADCKFVSTTGKIVCP